MHPLVRPEKKQDNSVQSFFTFLYPQLSKLANKLSQQIKCHNISRMLQDLEINTINSFHDSSHHCTHSMLMRWQQGEIWLVKNLLHNLQVSLSNLIKSLIIKPQTTEQTCIIILQHNHPHHLFEYNWPGKNFLIPFLQRSLIMSVSRPGTSVKWTRSVLMSVETTDGFASHAGKTRWAFVHRITKFNAKFLTKV